LRPADATNAALMLRCFFEVPGYLEASAMKRAALAIFCYAFLLASPPSAGADAVFDQDMASRYLRAAQSGDDEAQFYLGSLYAAGVGVPRSDQEAFRWFSRAADQGHSHAMLLVAGFYAIGRGVERNNAEAYKWAYIVNGASRVDEFRDGSRQLMGVLEKRMSPDEINRAKSDAGKWRAVATSRPATAPASADDSRTAPVVSAPTVTSAAPAAAPPPTAPTPQPSTPSSNDNPMDTFGKNFSKGDVDDLLREMPAMRKKFGF
jgi:Sel1 repeat